MNVAFKALHGSPLKETAFEVKLKVEFYLKSGMSKLFLYAIRTSRLKHTPTLFSSSSPASVPDICIQLLYSDFVPSQLYPEIKYAKYFKCLILPSRSSNTVKRRTCVTLSCLQHQCYKSFLLTVFDDFERRIKHLKYLQVFISG